MAPAPASSGNTRTSEPRVRRQHCARFARRGNQTLTGQPTLWFPRRGARGQRVDNHNHMTEAGFLRLHLEGSSHKMGPRVQKCHHASSGNWAAGLMALMNYRRVCAPLAKSHRLGPSEAGLLGPPRRQWPPWHRQLGPSAPRAQTRSLAPIQHEQATWKQQIANHDEISTKTADNLQQATAGRAQCSFQANTLPRSKLQRASSQNNQLGPVTNPSLVSESES